MAASETYSAYFSHTRMVLLHNVWYMQNRDKRVKYKDPRFKSPNNYGHATYVIFIAKRKPHNCNLYSYMKITSELHIWIIWMFHAFYRLWLLLLTWFNFDPRMDK